MRLQIKLAVFTFLIIGAFARRQGETTWREAICDPAKELGDILEKLGNGNGWQASNIKSVASNISNQLNSLSRAIDGGTSAIKAASKPISKSDGEKILEDLFHVHYCLWFAMKGVTGVVHTPFVPQTQIKQDLVNLKAHLSKFDTALIAAVPADLVVRFENIKTRVAHLEDEVAAAISVYSRH